MGLFILHIVLLLSLCLLRGSGLYRYHDEQGIIYQDVPDPELHVNLTVGISRAHMEVGNPNLIPGISIHGAIILSDMALGKVPRNLSSISPHQWNTYRKISARIQNYRNLQRELPFFLTRWSGVIGPPCPSFPHGHRTERGLAYAHYMIWKDFASFDRDTLYRFQRDNHSIVHSDDKSHLIYPNGTKIRYGTEYKEEDVLLILEDDALNIVNGLNKTIVEELSNMRNIDILFLGWCEGRTARPYPLCAHSYAVTRAGARKLVKYFEPCGRAVDEQLVIFLKNNFIRHRRANKQSYQSNVKAEYKYLRDKTDGIFRQNKETMGSINGHRRRRR